MGSQERGFCNLFVQCNENGREGVSFFSFSLKESKRGKRYQVDISVIYVLFFCSFFLILFFFRASLDFCSHDISARCVFHLSPGYNCDDVTVINPFTKFIAVFVYFMLFFKRLYMRRLHMDLEIFFFQSLLNRILM